MKDFAQKYLDWYNGLSKIAKVLLCLLWDVPSNLYRFSKSALKDNMAGIILAVIIGIFGGWILFIIDIVCLILKEKIYWLDDLGIEESENCGCDDCHCNDCNCDAANDEKCDCEDCNCNEAEKNEDQNNGADGTVED